MRIVSDVINLNNDVKKAKPNIDEEKMKKYKKGWYEKKKEELHSKAKEAILCECGKEVCRGAFTKHLKSKHLQAYEQSLNNNN